MEEKYTCISCRVLFKDGDIQRAHYKTDWHRYNLKRKVADLPPVSAEDFQDKVLQQREQDASQQRELELYCQACRKTFSSQNSYDNHLHSKKHKICLENAIPKSEDNHPSLSDDSVEEVDSDEWEEEVGDNPILNNNCLFCSHHSKSLLKNVKHMSDVHSFFIPDAEFLIDLKGLLMYLGEKVTQGKMCLWCSEKGKSFYTIESVQQHMIDKGHCKMLHEGEALAEYEDFYDYRASYPDEEHFEEDVPCDDLDGSDYQLVLPSGAIIGHRSLMRYYRQNLKPDSAVTPQKKIHKVLAHYKALGWTGTQKELVERKARDIQFMKRVQSKYMTMLGVKANKLQKHFRPQVNF